MAIYVLKLENNKFYIGSTKDIKQRMLYHKECPNEWIKKYPIINIYETIESITDIEIENNLVKIYMSNYGINSTRGGSFSELYLNHSQINFLIKELKYLKTICSICHQSGHSMQQCIEDVLSWETIDKEDSFDESISNRIC